MTEEFKKQIETQARQAVTELLAEAKLKKGDVIYSVNNELITSAKQLSELLEKCTKGTAVTLEIHRTIPAENEGAEPTEQILKEQEKLFWMSVAMCCTAAHRIMCRELHFPETVQSLVVPMEETVQRRDFYPNYRCITVQMRPMIRCLAS